MKEKSLAISSTLAAFLASLCCLGPLVLGGVGIGAALVGTFAPLRPYFLALSGILLALGFYSVYRKPKATPGCEGEPCAMDGRTNRLARLLIWIAAIAVAALALFPWYGAKLFRKRAEVSAASVARLQTAELKISGMTCEACASLLNSKLRDLPGVAKVRVNFRGQSAEVKYDPARITPAKFIETVRIAGFNASLADEKKE